MNFEFCATTRVIFEPGGLARGGALVGSLGGRVMVVRGEEHLDNSGAISRLERSLSEHGMTPTYRMVRGEPTVSLVDELAATARAAACDVVIGLGGGSALDAAKAVAGLITNAGRALDYLEVVGSGKPLAAAAAPLIAIPTTAGTGTEVTRNAVLAYPQKRFKASMRSPHLIPRIALIDPELTHSLPPEATASTGLDALTQLIEPYVCVRHQPLTDALALMGIRLIKRSLRRAIRDGGDCSAREDMSLAALLGGICLANAGLGAVHGFAAPLGASYPVPHGVACAVLLPHVMAANVDALRMEDSASPALQRYAEVAEALLGHRELADAELIRAAIREVKALVREVGTGGLGQYGLKLGDVPDLVERAKRASSMRANPVTLSDEALADCLQRAL